MYKDEGHLLETIIHNELIYNGYNVNVGAFESVEKNKNGKSVRKNYEIDFMATKGTDKMYLQIADNISESETKNRETRPFVLLNDQIKKVIVINRPIKEMQDESGFTVIGVVDFLLAL